RLVPQLARQVPGDVRRRIATRIIEGGNVSHAWLVPELDLSHPLRVSSTVQMFRTYASSCSSEYVIPSCLLFAFPLRS
ncbi:MAG: hypothetical protein ABJA33_00245, partial [Pedococcus sp.]